MTDRDLKALCGELDGRREPAGVELDEYWFVEWNLQRWHDRAYEHLNKKLNDCPYGPFETELDY
jgi:hypothetical protein